MSGLTKYCDELAEQSVDARETLQEIARELEKHDDRDGEHFQRVQEFNSAVFWLTKVIMEGLPEAVEKFYGEVKGVLK